MTANAISPSTRASDLWQKRRRRAAALRARLPYARETLTFYQRLLDAQEPVHTRTLADRPMVIGLTEYIVSRAPAVVAAAASAGTTVVVEAARTWLHERAAADVAAWLAGEPLPPAEGFLARACAAPVLEAMAACGTLTPASACDPQHCPRCGGLPQLAYTSATGDPLMTAPLLLCCARCGDHWPGARLRCAACGESSSARLCGFAADEQLPHLRVDACQTCRSYLVHVDLRRDPEAVPEVDELAALPLDLHAQEQGFGKITSNLMGIG